MSDNHSPDNVLLPPELIAAYMDNRLHDCEKLRKALASKDADVFAQLGHRIKGSGPAYGFEDLGEIGKQLHRAGTDNDLPAMQYALSEFEAWISAQGHTGGQHSTGK